MFKVLAKTFSFLLHPLFMPTYGILIMFQAGSVAAILPWEVKQYVLMVVVANTLVLPMLLLPIFVKRRMAKDYNFSDKKERMLPLLFTFILYAVTFYFIGGVSLPSIIKGFLLGSTIAVLLTFVVNIFWKVSIHMVGIGGLMGMIFLVILKLLSSIVGFLLVGFLFSGVIGTSRLYLGEHNLKQIAGGYALGMITMICTIYLF
ncbi:hypothetical protein [uncultured Acetobacteroides sp.]|uniref:hypothetical protein n=1 Tax=uncultured Acetobacteroides sp. TaxID=1760811 RepID=UPI0029F4E3E5|nr:hypothetical protein [uncultured Acetobacteroides sp.]